jgi:hypothetical protein
VDRFPPRYQSFQHLRTVDRSLRHISPSPVANARKLTATHHERNVGLPTGHARYFLGHGARFRLRRPFPFWGGWTRRGVRGRPFSPWWRPAPRGSSIPMGRFDRLHRVRRRGLWSRVKVPRTKKQTRNARPAILCVGHLPGVGAEGTLALELPEMGSTTLNCLMVS